MVELIAVFQSKEEISFWLALGYGLVMLLILYGIVFPVCRAVLYSIGYTVFCYRVYERSYSQRKLIASLVLFWPLMGFTEGLFKPRRVWVTDQLSWFPPLNYGPGRNSGDMK
jgi:hypothetical protein